MTPRKARTRKKCSECGKTMPEDKRADALYCSKRCMSSYRRRESLTNDAEGYRAYHRRAAKKYLASVGGALRNRRYQMLRRAKSRAQIHNVPFALELTDIVIPDACPVLGIKLSQMYGRGLQHDSPSLDRIFPALGYVPGNVRVISHRANQLKNNATAGEIERVLMDLRSIETLQKLYGPAKAGLLISKEGSCSET